MTDYIFQTQVPSSDDRRMYTVSETMDGEWQCSCVGWTQHFPRRDCKHIKGVKAERDVSDVSAIAPAPWTAETANDAIDTVIRAAEGKTVKALVKEGATPDEAADFGRVKREANKAKKAAKFKGLRYGFQLAHTYDPSDVARGEWAAEIKYDGELAMWIDGRLINRGGNDVTHRFPEIRPATDAVLVGELVILDENDMSAGAFNKIQNRATDDEIRIYAMSRSMPATFMVFDMLELPGAEALDITRRPLRERRAIMEVNVAFAGRGGRVRMTEQIPVRGDEDVQALVETCRKLEQEGVMLKDLDAPYVARRGRNWVKAKTWQEREFDIVSHGPTGIGDGYIITIRNKGREQIVNLGSYEMRRKIQAGHKCVEIKFLSESEDGALRFPSVRRLR